jgi:Family of unknown function (DUF5955)
MGDITVHGNVTGNVQSGEHAVGTFTHNESTPAPGQDGTTAAERLLAAVEALREHLDATSEAAAGLHADDVRIATDALDEVTAAAQEGEPRQGRLRTTVATLTGALASAAGLAQAVADLRAAAAPWF